MMLLGLLLFLVVAATITVELSVFVAKLSLVSIGNFLLLAQLSFWPLIQIACGVDQVLSDSIILFLASFSCIIDFHACRAKAGFCKQDCFFAIYVKDQITVNSAAAKITKKTYLILSTAFS